MDSTSVIKLSSRPRKEFDFVCGEYTLRLGRGTQIMGILNVTFDSFSQDGIYKDPQRAKAQALQMIEEGATIIDVGGESTRPEARPVSEQEEKERVLPVIRELAKEIKIPISVDTTKARVAQAALEEGASIINDISALKFDPQMAPLLSRCKAGCVLMHIKGTPQTMQRDPVYGSVIEEIIVSLTANVSLAQAAGIAKRRIVIDPGIGFGKTTEHNLKILSHLRDFECLDLPILIGTSRKSFIGNVLDLPLGERIWGTAASVAVSVLNGAHIVRVHDVQEIVQVVRMSDAILNA